MNDYLIVGSGLTGATMARLLITAGNSVHIVERRPHIAGNIYDTNHSSGIRYNLYGAHYFRTNCERIWEFINSFGEFYTLEGRVMSQVDDHLEHWPIQSSYLKKGEEPTFKGNPTNFEEACLAMMPERIYQKFVKGYTEKQWGVKCTKLSPSLAKRFDVRTDGDTRLKQDKYQGMPKEGYTKLIETMLKDIPITLNCNYLTHKNDFKARTIIFTGSIDEYHQYKLGHLRYRTQRRKHTYLNFPSFQKCMAVNYPNDYEHIRSFEWKKMMQNPPDNGTLITFETPEDTRNPDKFEYPFPDEENASLYQKYTELPHENTFFAGRLGEYRYLDMDQAIARAMKHVQTLLT